MLLYESTVALAYDSNRRLKKANMTSVFFTVERLRVALESPLGTFVGIHEFH